MANATVAAASGANSNATPKTAKNAKEALSTGLPLELPKGTIVEEFSFVEVSKGGQFKYEQEREIPAEVLAIAPYLKGTKRPALFNEYRGNPGIYLAGETMKANGYTNPERDLKRFALVLIPL